ncbi:hypothetical protein LZ554_008676 [Drepanopeziza brunnea f. sp. 'monogermtubi']|nr:hypothetical protein LZ554_008676 [Drepanopeziza brunnea f. sp. 'monogermtubi']
MAIDRPIPAFYCCYLLRSTVRGSSVYVGSTPNPVRRLRQHNGVAKGGAVRTSRQSLRPWAMTCIVTGFPSHIAALQFEWAWQNPHITLHIPPSARIQHAAGRKKSGQPKRPKHTVASLLSNLHLLLRVPSFARWPLELRFFCPDVYKSWLRWCKAASEPVHETLTIVTDFPPEAAEEVEREEDESGVQRREKRKASYGVEALDVEYEDVKQQVEKGKSVIDFEREGSCALCKEELEHEGGVYAICPSRDCEAVSHLTCLSRHFLGGRDEEDEVLLPIKGTCPSCKEDLKWADVVKELTLRMRGQKEVEKLLRVKRVRKTKATASQPFIESEDEEEDTDDEMSEHESHEELKRGSGMQAGASRPDTEMGDTWHEVDDSEESDTGSIASHISQGQSQSQSQKPTSYQATQAGTLRTVIEDSDWDDADIIE